MKYEVSKLNIVYAMSSNNEPVLRVPDHSTVVFHTCDCFEDQIQSEQMDFGELDWQRINPATGPIYIENAEPGDLLAIYIEKIALADRGVMTIGPKLGVFGDELLVNSIRMVPIYNEKAWITSDLGIPINPMIGVIGTAPQGVSISCGTPGAHGGNMDCKKITTGAYLVLPVNVPGALLALGDLHAAMGDGEVGVSGVEISGSVTVQVHVLKGKVWPAPLLINDQTVMTIASADDLDEAGELAAKQMARLLEQECQMSTSETVFLLSAAGNLRVCQVVDPKKTARMELPRWILEQRGFVF
ncbi:acetamidase/formamidase family protein [Sulfoacidibacillus thermotolerans]|uniref:Acetamidase n=1 Tax=Sulfoacidibacillus thermotolerans TaxID=1765684 RepID=A0A2U3DBK6_SULT2|nr:acetamidase/formamidase family protein [Sulfoacidibacillus thermotolerans]PWI58669.1 acetamidase [Sulfoacidibacillus thermotolerans]